MLIRQTLLFLLKSKFEIFLTFAVPSAMLNILRSLIIKVEPEEAVCGENGFAYLQGSRPLQCSQDNNACPEVLILLKLFQKLDTSAAYV